MPSPKLIFAGSGEFGVPTLHALLAANYPIVQVITQPDRPAGRGRKLAPTPVALFAEKHALPLIKTDNINKESLPPADVMVVIAFGQKISEGVVHAPRLGSINLHASRLPKYRGAAPIHWAILSGETTAGNSVIRLANRMDAGAILGQSELTIGEVETAGELHDRLAIDGVPLVLRVLIQLVNDSAVETPQDESRATLAPKLSRETARINWNAPADQIARTIRGLSPWPGCRARVLDAAGGEVARLTLLRARPAPGEGSRWRAGEVTINGHVSAADGAGAVEILELQPEGKRPMSLDAYRRGHAWQPGLRLESI